MSKLRLLKGFLENTSVQNLIIKRGLKLAIAGCLITSMSVSFIGCKANKASTDSEAKSSVEETIEKDENKDKQVDSKSKKDEKTDSKSKKDEDKKDTTKEKKSDTETNKKTQNNNITSTPVQSGNKKYKATNNNTAAKTGNVVVVNTTSSINTSATTTTNKEQKVETTKVQEPKSEDPKIQNPTTEDSKTQDPKTEDPKIQDPKTEDPKVQDPKTEDPKVQDSKTYSEDTMPANYLNLSKESVKKALSDKGFKYNEKLKNSKYTKSILVPMYESNNLKENEINELTNILTKSKSTEFNLIVNRNAVQAKDHMRIILYFNPDLTDANNDGYEDSLMLDSYTKEELSSLENDYKNLLNINGYKLVDYVDGSNKIGEVIFPMHHNNAHKEAELSKILNLLDTLNSENISMKIQANNNATITLNFYDTIKKEVKEDVTTTTVVDKEKEAETPVVVVSNNTAPVIECVDEIAIKQGDKFDLGQLKLKITDKEDGDKVSIIIDDSSLNTSKPGPYSIIVKATDSQGMQTTKVVLAVVTTNDVPSTTPVVSKTNEKKSSNSLVVVYNNTAPVIECVDEIAINQGDKFDVSKLNLKVTDKEDGDNVKIVIDDSALNTSKPGPHPIIIKATDSKGLQATKVVLAVVAANTQA